MFYVSQNNPGSFEKGLQFLHQAVAIDPSEPLAYVGLAEGYVTLGHGGGDDPAAFPRARAAAEQALTLDPDRAEAISALADVALYYEWDWTKAERLFARALELNSSLAMTHYHYAWYLALFDRLDQAIAEHKRARDLDPLRALHTGWLGGLDDYGGRYEEAVVEANKALELSPDFRPSYLVLRRAYSGRGMHQEAIAAAKRLAEVRPVVGAAQLTVAYALAGQREQALATASGLKGARGNPLQLARARLAVGDADGAFRQLEDAFRAHWSTLPWIRVHGGDWDDVRGEPRFQDLLRRMNLPL
jgi:tetratricopeptide (TPR) repeat protein